MGTAFITAATSTTAITAAQTTTATVASSSPASASASASEQPTADDFDQYLDPTWETVASTEADSSSDAFRTKRAVSDSSNGSNSKSHSKPNRGAKVSEMIDPDALLSLFASDREDDELKERDPSPVSAFHSGSDKMVAVSTERTASIMTSGDSPAAIVTKSDTCYKPSSALTTASPMSHHGGHDSSSNDWKREYLLSLMSQQMISDLCNRNSDSSSIISASALGSIGANNSDSDGINDSDNDSNINSNTEKRNSLDSDGSQRKEKLVERDSEVETDSSPAVSNLSLGTVHVSPMWLNDREELRDWLPWLQAVEVEKRTLLNDSEYCVDCGGTDGNDEAGAISERNCDVNVAKLSVAQLKRLLVTPSADASKSQNLDVGRKVAVSSLYAPVATATATANDTSTATATRSSSRNERSAKTTASCEGGNSKHETKSLRQVENKLKCEELNTANHSTTDTDSIEANSSTAIARASAGFRRSRRSQGASLGLNLNENAVWNQVWIYYDRYTG
jgi:hypothetical protein